MPLDIHSSASLISDVPDLPTVFLVEGRYQNWIKPIIMLEYLGISWQPVVLDGPAAGSEWYSKIHPQLYFPALADNIEGNRVVLWDSTSILWHLGERPTAKYWVWYDMRTGDAVNQKAWDKMMADLEKQYTLLNWRLSQSGQQWLALKDRPTIADIATYPFVDNNTLGRMKLNVKRWPALHDWVRRMSELPYVFKAYAEMGSRKAMPIN